MVASVAKRVTLPAYQKRLKIAIVILTSVLVIGLMTVPRAATYGANSPAKHHVRVNLLIDYGNGTLVWHNRTRVPSNWNFYNVTNLDTNGNIAALFFASFGSHFVYQINGVGCPSSNPFCDNSWGLWILEGSCWVLASVGVDQIPVSPNAAIGWYLVPGSTLGNTPPTGVNCMSVNIDVNPPTDPAIIHLRHRDTVSVMILSTSTFNATREVVTSSLTFGRMGTEDSLEYCGSSVQGGLTNLVCHFDLRESGFRHGDTQAILNGFTRDGTPIVGTDPIVVA